MIFEKWQALGNDYMIIERSELAFELSEARIRKICASHLGVGADGILLLSKSEDPDIVAELAIYNPDGSRAELSGNGAREAILYLRRRGWTDRDSFTIMTDAGPVTPQITGAETCRVDMGRARLQSAGFPDGPGDGAGELRAGPQIWRFRHVSIGNPQCAIAVGDLEMLEALELATIGPPIESHPVFPNRTNVSFYTELQGASEARPARIRARIFERGVGETLSSGTGATGAAIAYLLHCRRLGSTGAGAAAGRAGEAAGRDRPGGAAVSVVLDGGELLVEVSEDLQVQLTGWARPVFSGRLSDELIKELHETQ